MGFHFKDLSHSTHKLHTSNLYHIDPTMFLLNTTSIWLFTTNPKHSVNAVFVERVFWAKLLLLMKIQVPNRLFYVVDGAQFPATATNWVVQFNTNTMLSDTRVHIITSLPVNDLTLTTTSTLFKSSTWLERELSDFTNIYFDGLVDTRRLLLDYFEEKQVYQSHVSNDKNFNNNLYDVSLNF